jgi:hypothetical protein
MLDDDAEQRGPKSQLGTSRGGRKGCCCSRGADREARNCLSGGAVDVSRVVLLPERDDAAGLNSAEPVLKGKYAICGHQEMVLRMCGIARRRMLVWRGPNNANCASVNACWRTEPDIRREMPEIRNTIGPRDARNIDKGQTATLSKAVHISSKSSYILYSRVIRSHCGCSSRRQAALSSPSYTKVIASPPSQRPWSF